MEAECLIRESETDEETCLSSSLRTSDGFQQQNNQTVIVDRDEGYVWNLNGMLLNSLRLHVNRMQDNCCDPMQNVVFGDK